MELSSSDLENLEVNNYIYLNTYIYVAMTIRTNNFWFSYLDGKLELPPVNCQ